MKAPHGTCRSKAHNNRPLVLDEDGVNVTCPDCPKCRPEDHRPWKACPQCAANAAKSKAKRNETMEEDG